MGFLSGRTNRPTYWLSLGVVVAIIGIGALVFHAQAKVSEIILIMVCVPRLHDIGRSGWVAVGVVLAEIVVLLGAVMLNVDDETFELLAGLTVLVIAGLLIWLGCIPSDKVSNRFGYEPTPGIGFRSRP